LSTASVIDTPLPNAPAPATEAAKSVIAKSVTAAPATPPVTTAQYRALLAQRRERLVLRAQQQRVQLAHSLEPAARAARWLDRGAGLWRTARGRPGVVLAGALVPAVVLAIWKPGLLLRAFTVALALWRIKNAWSAAGRAPDARSR
jgi:hypothetical protein